MERTNYASGSPLEEVAGYSRAVKVGNMIHVGGTTSVLPDGSVAGEGDSYAQMKFILDKMIGMVEKAGGSVETVYSVDMFTTDDFDGAEGFKAYTEYFKEIKPLCTSVKIAGLNRPTQLVEVKMSAYVK